MSGLAEIDKGRCWTGLILTTIIFIDLRLYARGEQSSTKVQR